MLLNDQPIHVLKQESLPLFVNSAEWNLAPAVSVSPPINLVMYIPAKKSRPLYLLKHNGALSGTDSFLIHRWGGISVQNLPTGYDDLAYHFDTHTMKPVMEIFVAQLRELLGIRETTIYNAAELFVSTGACY
jgi:phosphatidylinositol glycan class S